MSLGGYRASLRAGSKSILMLVTESHNSADLQWSGVSNIVLSTMETPQVKCRCVCVCVCVCVHAHTEYTRAHFSPFLWPSEHLVCLLPHHALHWGCECICTTSLDYNKHRRSKRKKFLLCFIMLTVLSKWLRMEWAQELQHPPGTAQEVSGVWGPHREQLAALRFSVLLTSQFIAVIMKHYLELHFANGALWSTV